MFLCGSALTFKKTCADLNQNMLCFCLKPQHVLTKTTCGFDQNMRMF